MKHVLSVHSFRHRERDNRGRVVTDKRYRKGDDLSHLDDETLDRLEAAGALEETEDEADEDFGPQTLSEANDPSSDAPVGPGALSGATDSQARGAAGDGQGDATLGGGTPDGDGGDDSKADDLNEKSFAELQEIAKSETGNGAGGAEALKARIRKHRSQQS